MWNHRTTESLKRTVGKYRNRLNLCDRMVGLAFFMFVLSLGAGAQTAPLSADEVVTRMMDMDAQRAAKNQAYRSIRHYTVEYRGFPSDKQAEMTVQVTVNPPQKELVITSESGSKLLLNHVLHKLVETELEAASRDNRRETKLTPENYRFELEGMDDVEGRRCYILQVTPKHDNKLLYKGKVWVDADDFAVKQIEAKPAKNPSFWISSVQIQHEYEKYGDVWLPRSNRSTSKARFGGHAVLTIDYGQYELLDSRTAEAHLGGQ